MLLLLDQAADVNTSTGGRVVHWIIVEESKRLRWYESNGVQLEGESPFLLLIVWSLSTSSWGPSLGSTNFLLTLAHSVDSKPLLTVSCIPVLCAETCGVDTSIGHNTLVGIELGSPMLKGIERGICPNLFHPYFPFKSQDYLCQLTPALSSRRISTILSKSTWLPDWKLAAKRWCQLHQPLLGLSLH